MTVNNIFSTLENVAKLIDGREGKERSIKEQFDKKVGINKEQHDEVVSLTRTYEDAEDSVRQYDKEIEQCTKSLNKLDTSIQKLEENLKKTNTPESRDKVQKEIDKKRDERYRIQTRKENLSNSQFEEKQSLRRAKRKLNRMGVAPDKAKQSLGKMDKALTKNASSGLSSMLGKVAKISGPIAAVGALVKAIEFGIDKSTEYMKLNADNLMRGLNANFSVGLNQIQASLSSWQDAVTGAYSAQELYTESQLDLLKAQNETEMANLKMSNTWTNWIPIWGEVNKYAEAELEIRQKIAELELEQASKVLKQVNEFTQKTDDYLRIQDKAVHAYQAENGFSVSQTSVFEDRMLGLGETFAKYNKTIADALKMQSSYTEQSGRAFNFSNNEYEKNFAVGRLVGEDNLVNFEAQMNIFNQSVSDSADVMYNMYKDANRIGLSQKKLVKDVLGNLKLANKYDFKNGTKGFIELSKWAENARFNLGSLGGALEKIQSGGLENTITTSAKLQVLGGPFAMYSDPLGMEFNANADPEEYAKMIQKMFSTMGRFDKETGQTTFNYAENKMIRSAAETLGISVEDAKNMARGARQKDVVKQQMGGSSLSNEDQDAIANKAQYNQETGKWYVNTISGKPIDVDKVGKGDLNKILSGNSEEDATKYAQGTLSTVERIESATKAIAAKLGAATFENFVSTAETDIHNLLTAYDNNFDEIVAAIKDARADASKKQQEMFNALKTIAGDAKYARAKVDEKKHSKQTTQEIYERATQTGRNAKRLRNDQKEFDEKGDVSSAMVMFHRAKAKGRNVFAQARDWTRGLFMSDEGALAKGRQTANDWESNFDEQGRIKIGARPKIKDGVASGNGSPMVVSASNVTPIQDGAVKLAKSDPKDSAVFAKTGGPFDKLFDDIFGKVNAIYDMSVRYGSTTNNRYGGNMVQSMLENHFANVFGSTSTTNNRYSGDIMNTSVNFDPLWTLYDSWRNPQAHAHRMQEINPSQISINTLSRIVAGDSLGQINPRIGETEFNMVENMQMSQIAKLQGRSIDDVRSNLTQKNYVEPAPDRKPREYAMPSTSSINELAKIASQGNAFCLQQPQGFNQPLDVHIHGDLNLKAPTGETINLTNIIQNDPMLIRKITELIICQIGKNIHGGRTELNRNRFAYT